MLGIISNTGGLCVRFKMNIVAKIAERIPEVVDNVVTEGSELIIAPNLIAPANNAVSILPFAQVLLGLALVALVGFALSRSKLNLRNVLRI